jgi:hypothetical protein
MAQKRMTPPDNKQTVENLQFFSFVKNTQVNHTYRLT